IGYFYRVKQLKPRTMKHVEAVIQALEVMKRKNEIDKRQADTLINRLKKHIKEHEASKEPIGICNRTKTLVYPTEVDGYSAYCPELNEDLYSFEFTPLK